MAVLQFECGERDADLKNASAYRSAIWHYSSSIRKERYHYSVAFIIIPDETLNVPYLFPLAIVFYCVVSLI